VLLLEGVEVMLLRRVDPLDDATVLGLTVHAAPAEQPLRRVRAFASTSGVYGWFDLPGLRGRTFGAGDDAYWREAPPPLPFVIDVVDEAGRYLPARLTVRAPARGVWTWDCDPDESPPAALGAVPLHSAPARVPPAVTAVIRAELRDADADRPAAWAVVEARVGGRRVARGMADARGSLLLLAPCPEPPPPPLGASGSPPGASRVALWEQRWPLRLDVRYAPRPAGAERDPPDLCEALLQPPAIVWGDAGGGATLGDLELRYGEPLYARTEGAGGALLVSPAGSPP
jgi:hypothetical protein